MEKSEYPASAPWNGAVPAGSIASVIRIPVPGTDNLAIELSPRNYALKSSSSIFIQDIYAKKVLRLDYGFNVKSNTVDYHWNQKGTFADFGIVDHTKVGRVGASIYESAKFFRYVGRSILVVGAAMDVFSIVTASNPLRCSTEVVSAWAMAWAGAEVAGASGAWAGSAVAPGLGTVTGGIVFGIAGGIGGYIAGSKLGATVYDWAANTVFFQLPEIAPTNR